MADLIVIYCVHPERSTASVALRGSPVARRNDCGVRHPAWLSRDRGCGHRGTMALMQQQESVRVVVAAVIERDGLILAARRTGPPALAGRWEFPGGKVEPGESD